MLEIIGKAKGSYSKQYQYRHYRLPCGHERDLKVQHVKSGKFRCKECLLEEDKSAANLNGFEMIADTDDSDYKIYKHNACGSMVRLAKYSMSVGSVSCKNCTKTEQEIAAFRNNLTIVEKKPSTLGRRIYQFNDCKHEQEMKLQDVSANRIPKCLKCREIGWKTIAVSKGLLHLEQVGTMSSLYKLPCGCIKELRHGNVKLDKWACDKHSSWWQKESTVYLFEIKTDSKLFLKLGVATSPLRRIDEYKISNLVSFELVATKTFMNAREATLFEKSLHSKLSSFNLDHTLMKVEMASGWSECYPFEIKDKIQRLLL